VPFLSERLWLQLQGSREEAVSVHLAPYPEPDPALVDEELEQRMEGVRRVVRLGRAGRNRANVKTRQPLGRVRIAPGPGAMPLGDLTPIVLEELNVKEAEVADAGEEVVRLHAKARFDVLGPRFGKGVPAVAKAIEALPPETVLALERVGGATVRVEGVEHEIRREEVQIRHEDPEGWVMERESGWSVALDLAIDEELRQEGFAREIVNKIQFMRKKAGFGITDRIEVVYQGTDLLRSAIDRHGELIRRETQADRIDPGPAEGEASGEWKINGEPAVFSLKRVG
jgi:isoleucyl-tRNA synthetase